MTRDVGTDTQEIFGEMQEDLARNKPSMHHNRNSHDSDSSGKSFLLWGFIGIILILLIVVLFRGEDKAVTETLDALKNRVEQIEKRAAALDPAAKRMDAIEGQIKALQHSISKTEATHRSLAERIEKLAQHAEKPPAPQAVQKKPTAQAKVHVVRPGETVFSIAKKYNLSADQLLKLNKLSKRDTLQAGQKLVVAP